MWIVGVTGAIGAGKSSITRMFFRAGIPVLSADKEVHNLFFLNRDVQRKVQELWPDAVVQGKISREVLWKTILKTPSALQQLENIIYPKLAPVIKKFIMKNQFLKSKIVVLDIPLLMEVGLDQYCNCVFLVSARRSHRKERALRRALMTEKKFDIIESNQMDEKERRIRADVIIWTGLDKASTVRKMMEILNQLTRLPSPQWGGTWPTNFKREIYGKGNRTRYRNNRF